jgi:hypothetical protein
MSEQIRIPKIGDIYFTKGKYIMITAVEICEGEDFDFSTITYYIDKTDNHKRTPHTVHIAAVNDWEYIYPTSKHYDIF